jgi:hypothetical protein
MNLHPATTKVIKAGKSKVSFLLFIGNRKHEENEHAKLLSTAFTGIVLALAIVILGICIYAFVSGKLG